MVKIDENIGELAAAFILALVGISIIQIAFGQSSESTVIVWISNSEELLAFIVIILLILGMGRAAVHRD